MGGFGLCLGWGFGFRGGFGLGFGKHPPGLVDGPGLHTQGLCFPGGQGFPLGQPFGGPCGFPAIISINKIIITIFTIMSINYVRISRLNLRYQKYPISKETYIFQRRPISKSCLKLFEVVSAVQRAGCMNLQIFVTLPFSPAFEAFSTMCTR